MKLWIARDKNSCLWIYESRPIEFEEKYFIDVKDYFADISSAELPKEWFPEVTFENSPREIELKLVNCL